MVFVYRREFAELKETLSIGERSFLFSRTRGREEEHFGGYTAGFEFSTFDFG